ncbi:hypothetical protein THICB3560174 [Thiomonas sp. CB3]|nr:hypothetical protein THICB3560174 [Thiomonas sp. CB3]
MSHETLGQGCAPTPSGHDPPQCGRRRRFSAVPLSHTLIGLDVGGITADAGGFNLTSGRTPTVPTLQSQGRAL